MTAEGEDGRTLEQYLMNRCQSMEQEIQDRADFLIGKLRDSYQRQAANLRAAAAATIDDVEASRYDLILTITDLPEPDAEDEDAEDYSKSKYCGEIWRFEDIQEGQVFPIGRSKSKKMIHQGVSLSKDDRVSTKHGNIELREGRLLYTDLKSSNGTLLGDFSSNSECLTALKPVEIKDGSLLGIGRNKVHVTFVITGRRNDSSSSSTSS